METSAFVFAVLFAALIAVVVVYFARTTWLAQNRAHEMAHLAITSALASRNESMPIAATLAARREERSNGVMGYQAGVDPAEQRLVRVPLAESGRDPNNLYDVDSDYSS